MSRSFNLLICLLLSNGISFLTAAAASPVQPVPTHMKWVVDVKPAASKAPADPQMDSGKNIKIVREENISVPGLRKEVKLYADGTSLERYTTNDKVIYFDPRSNFIEIDTPGADVYGGPFDLHRFSELSWLNADFYIGEKTFNGINCDVYRHTWPIFRRVDGSISEEKNIIGSSPSTNNASQEILAFIDRKTRLPVAIQTPDEIREYKFTPFSEALELPQDYKVAVEKKEAAIKRRKQRYMLPQ